MAFMDDLHENLLFHIISFLPTQDAVRTSLLSRKWQNLWRSLPSLDFDFHLFLPTDSFREKRQWFVDLVNQTLIGRSDTGLHKFRLKFYFKDASSRIENHVVSWIRYAVNHDAVVLDLDFQENPDFEEYTPLELFGFHLSAISNSCVRILNLHYCDLFFREDNLSGQERPGDAPPNHPLPLPPSVCILSIQSISLSQIFLTDALVSLLMTTCVNLESLVIEDSFAMDEPKIDSSKLKELSIRSTQPYFGGGHIKSVEICAPNLCSISFVDVKMGKFSLNDSSSLVEAHVRNEMNHFQYWSRVVRLLGSVKRLTTQNRWFELLASKDVFSRRFNNLSHLVLETGYSKNDLLGLAAFLELCPNLETLILDYLYQTDEDEMLPKDFISRINCSLPSLKRVKMRNFRGTHYELALQMLLKDQGVVLEKVEVVPAKMDAT